MSVLTKTLNSEVSFTADDCFIQEITQELMIDRGIQVGNLYLLDVDIKIHKSLSFKGMSCASAVADFNTWHKRLGHPSYENVD